MRDDYLQNALKVIDDPNILVNVISLRVKQLRRGSRPLVESLEKLLLEDIALREVAEGKITYELATPEELAHKTAPSQWRGATPSSAKFKTDQQAQAALPT
jgi:DNA-directed RNA polymerase subunit omega